MDKDGNYVANSASGQDAFGHQQLGGVGTFRQLHRAKPRRQSQVMCKLNWSACRRRRSSQTDNDAALMAGQAAVKAAMAGDTDKMVILVRGEGKLSGKPAGSTF